MKTTPPAVLLVEDNPDDAFLIRRAFKKAGLANPLQVVGDGEQAVAYLGGEGEYADRTRYPLPALLLLDLKLPRQDGLEVLAWLRQQPMLKRIVVVILTSSKEFTDIDKAYEMGANSYLVKPVGFDSLVDMVRTLNQYWLVLSERPNVCQDGRRRS